MLIQRFLKKLVHQNSPSWQEPFADTAVLKAVLGIRRVIFTSSQLLCQSESVLINTYPVQDQTEGSRQRVLQAAASLAATGEAPAVVSGITTAARQIGLPIREVEVDATAGLGVIGKLDRSWYLLGDAFSLQAEGVELGMATATLAQQIEAEGKYPLFLAMQGPKRLLAVFACRRQFAPHVPTILQRLHHAHVTSTVLTRESPIIAGAFYRELQGITPVSITSERERIQKIRQYEKEGAAVVTLGEDGSWPAVLHVPIATPNAMTEITLPSLEALPECLEVAHSLAERVRRRFFWCKI